MPGSFHLSFFVFRHLWRRSYQNQLSFSGKESTADFFVFRNLRKTKMGWNAQKFTQINKQYQSWKLVRNSWKFEILFSWKHLLNSSQKITILEWNSEKLLLCYTVNNIRTASDALYPSLCFDYLSLQARFLFAANFLSGRFHLHL